MGNLKQKLFSMEPNYDESLEINRKLASIQIISKIEDAPNSDSLAKAQVLGWQVVVKRNEFQVGQKIVYFEIDSILPDVDWSSFMKEKKFRIKSIKLRGELSQGLILPLTILGKDIKEESFIEGQDVTQILQVTKYEEPEVLEDVKFGSGKSCSFPKLIEKTDEPRIQSFPEYLTKFAGKPYVATLKYDGTSATYLFDPNNLEEFYACSRNNRRIGDDIYNQMADRYKIQEKLKDLKGRYAIQCEIYGPKIGKNFLKQTALKLVVFNIKDLIENIYLDLIEFTDVCKLLDLPMVDIIEKGDSFSYTLDQLKEKAKGNYAKTNNPREGLVFRLQKEWHKFGRNSFKIINDDYLLAMGKK